MMKASGISEADVKSKIQRKERVNAQVNGFVNDAKMT